MKLILKPFPGLKSYFKKVGDAKNNGYIIMSGISGRRYYIPNYEEYISYKQIISQGGFWQNIQLKREV